MISEYINPRIFKSRRSWHSSSWLEFSNCYKEFPADPADFRRSVFWSGS